MALSAKTRYWIFGLWLAAMGVLFALAMSTNLITFQNNFDKLAHFGGFFALMILPAVIIANALYVSAFAVFLTSFGILIELCQMYIPSRFCSPEDIMANTLGIAAGLMLAHYARARFGHPVTHRL